jgi:uncharacterized membrane protein
MKAKLERKIIDRAFEVGVILKTITAIGEIVTSFLAFFLTERFITHIAVFLLQGQLADDPNDPVAHYILRTVYTFSSGPRAFAFFYLFLHGIVKLFLMIGLLRGKIWAYPASIFFIGLFIVYEVFDYVQTGSLLLAGFAVFDLIVLWLVIKEYRIKRLKLAPKPKSA